MMGIIELNYLSNELIIDVVLILFNGQVFNNLAERG
jgi:hypothetical protein